MAICNVDRFLEGHLPVQNVLRRRGEIWGALGGPVNAIELKP